MEFGILLLRVFLGLALAAHGSQKLFGWFGGSGPHGTGSFFAQLGFHPGRPMAILAGLGELGGGLLLALGFLTPLAAAAVIAVMLVAIVSVHASKGFFADQGGFELPLTNAVVAASIAFVGPGPVSMDNAVGITMAGADWGVVAILLGVVGAAVALGVRGLRRRREQAPAR